MGVDTAKVDKPAVPNHAASTRRHPEQTTAQVFARDARLPDDAPLVFLERGGADRLRPEARASYLICPLDECENRAFTTRGGSKRDGFVHRAGAGGHGPETLAHHTSKHLIAAWLRDLYPDADVFPDTQEVENGQRPDVKLVFSDGRTVAYEVQFANLTAAEWQVRHDGYAALGIRDVWLFGGKRYDRQPRSKYADVKEVAVHPVFDTVLASGHPMLLIAPGNEVITYVTGTAITELLTAQGFLAPDRASSCSYRATWTPIETAPAVAGVINLAGMREQLADAKAGHAAWVVDRQVYLDEYKLGVEREEEAAAARLRKRQPGAWAPGRTVSTFPAVLEDTAIRERRGAAFRARPVMVRWYAMLAEVEKNRAARLVARDRDAERAPLPVSLAGTISADGPLLLES